MAAKNLLRVLLQAINDQAERTVEHISGILQGTTRYIAQISTGYSKEGAELGVVDLTQATLDLNNQEELARDAWNLNSRFLRAARHLSTEVSNETEAELQILVNELIDDIAGVKEHFTFEHDKILYLQCWVTNILNIKQNQIVKIFTIITAVFLPPTLVATFYGMNFAIMPELSWEHGFIYSVILRLRRRLASTRIYQMEGLVR